MRFKRLRIYLLRRHVYWAFQSPNPSSTNDSRAENHWLNRKLTGWGYTEILGFSGQIANASPENKQTWTYCRALISNICSVHRPASSARYVYFVPMAFCFPSSTTEKTTWLLRRIHQFVPWTWVFVYDTLTDSGPCDERSRALAAINTHRYLVRSVVTQAV